MQEEIKNNEMRSVEPTSAPSLENSNPADLMQGFIQSYQSGLQSLFHSGLPNAERLIGLSNGLQSSNDLAEKMNDVQKTEAFKTRDADLTNAVSKLALDYSQYSKQLSTQDMAEVQADGWIMATRAFEILTTHIYADAANEVALDRAIQQCDAWLEADKKGQVAVFTHTTTNNQGAKKDHYKKYSMGEPRLYDLTTLRTNMANRFNTLPKRVQAQNALSNKLSNAVEISKQRETVVKTRKLAYDAAVDSFWHRNPELLEKKIQRQRLTWILVGIMAVITLVVFFLKSSFPYGNLVFYGLLVLTAASVYFRFKLKDYVEKKMEKKHFNEDVKLLKGELDDAKAEFRKSEDERLQVQSDLSTHEAGNK